MVRSLGLVFLGAVAACGGRVDVGAGGGDHGGGGGAAVRQGIKGRIWLITIHGDYSDHEAEHDPLDAPVVVVAGKVPVNAPGGSGHVDFESLDGMSVAAEGSSNVDGDFVLDLPVGTFTPFVFFEGMYSGSSFVSSGYVSSVDVEPGEYATADFDFHVVE